MIGGSWTFLPRRGLRLSLSKGDWQSERERNTRRMPLDLAIDGSSSGRLFAGHGIGANPQLASPLSEPPRAARGKPSAQIERILSIELTTRGCRAKENLKIDAPIPWRRIRRIVTWFTEIREHEILSAWRVAAPCRFRGRIPFDPPTWRSSATILRGQSFLVTNEDDPLHIHGRNDEQAASFAFHDGTAISAFFMDSTFAHTIVTNGKNALVIIVRHRVDIIGYLQLMKRSSFMIANASNRTNEEARQERKFRYVKMRNTDGVIRESGVNNDRRWLLFLVESTIDGKIETKYSRVARLSRDATSKTYKCGRNSEREKQQSGVCTKLAAKRDWGQGWRRERERVAWMQVDVYAARTHPP